jgi:spore maturation protein CgeB
MHVLTILCQGGWMPINISEGWRRLGYSVEEFFYGTHMGKSWNTQGLESNYLINSQLLETAKRLKAQGKLDLIFAIIYDDVLEVETAKQLRSLDVPMVNYHVDLVGQWYRILRTGKYFDLVACAHMDSWQGLRRAGIKPYYLPMAANPPISSTQSTAKIQFDGVTYLGSPWLYRRQVLADLAQNKIPLQIYGRNWHRSTPDPANAQPYSKNLHDLKYYFLPRLQQEGWETLWQTVQQRLQSAPAPAGIATDINPASIKGSYRDDDFIPLIQGTAINLGFTHFLGTPGTSKERRQVRLREFEISMSGGFYLTQDCHQLQELFQTGQNIATWNNLPDLYEKIDYYLNHPVERDKIAKAAQSHCLQHHTWKSRFSKLIQQLKISQP